MASYDLFDLRHSMTYEDGLGPWEINLIPVTSILVYYLHGIIIIQLVTFVSYLTWFESHTFYN